MVVRYAVDPAARAINYGRSSCSQLVRRPPGNGYRAARDDHRYCVAMGASGWHSRVPYQDDIDAALQQARQHAYDTGDYLDNSSIAEEARSMSEEEYVARGIERLRAVFASDPVTATWEVTGEEDRIVWRAAQVIVTGPDSLLESQPYSGTHSVIDMTHVAEHPEEHAVTPSSDAYLEETFGTTRPAVEAIEDAIGQGRLGGFARWCGRYLIGYRDGQPAEIFFVGHSGD